MLRRSFIASACFAAADSERSRVEADTRARIRRGEDEHLIYYILQSSAFSALPAIEPASAATSSDPPPAVLARMQDFLRALPRPARDSRMQWWQKALPSNRRTLAGLTAAWASSTSFLHEKEFGGAGSEVYQGRGHSSDTSLYPGFTVWTGLGIIAALNPSARFDRVLIVGPGLDFAPRTGYRDDLPPESYQPFLTAHAVIDQKLGREGLRVVAADVNPRVVEFLRKQPLVPSLPQEAGNTEFLAYLQRLRPVTYVLEPIEANIVTRLVPGAPFDLIVATNVLLYFTDRELQLAISNIASMLRPGAYFIHNEARPSLEPMARACALPPIQGRTLEIARGAKAPLVDVLVIHRKGEMSAAYSR